MVNFVHDRGREHPRSASRRLGFAIDSHRDLGGRLLAGPTCGPRCIQDPVRARPPLDPPGRAAFISVLSWFGGVTASFFCIARTLLEKGPRQFRNVRARHHVLARTNIRDAEGDRAGFGRLAITIV